MAKKKWQELEVPSPINEIDELDGWLMYGAKIQFKTQSHRVINAILAFEAHFVDGGWAGADSYHKISKHDANYLKDNNQLITHYRIVLAE